MTTQIESSDLERAIELFKRNLFTKRVSPAGVSVFEEVAIAKQVNRELVEDGKRLLDAVNNLDLYKPLPDAVVNLIEFAEHDVSDNCFVSLELWVKELQDRAKNVRALIPCDLKPCPFCQSDNIQSKSNNSIEYVFCLNRKCAIYHVQCVLEKWQNRGELPA